MKPAARTQKLNQVYRDVVHENTEAIRAAGNLRGGNRRSKYKPLNK
jgi:hypothetical protein